MNLRPDPTFHASPKLAMQAPVENYAFTVMLSPDGSQSDGIAVIDLKPGSDTYGQIVHQVIVPNTGDEFHHFGWNACSSALSPLSGHAFLERRYLIVPGIRSSRIYVIDVKEPLKAKIHKTIEPEELFAKTGYSRPHTIHCGPEGIYVSTLGGGGEDGTDGPPGIFILDCETFEIIGRYAKNKDALGSVTDETNILEDLKVNSARLVDVILDFEDEFDIEVEDEDADAVNTIGDAVRLIQSKVA